MLQGRVEPQYWGAPASSPAAASILERRGGQGGLRVRDGGLCAKQLRIHSWLAAKPHKQLASARGLEAMPQPLEPSPQLTSSGRSRLQPPGPQPHRAWPSGRGSAQSRGSAAGQTPRCRGTGWSSTSPLKFLGALMSFSSTPICMKSLGRDRPRGSKPRSPGREPSSHSGRVVLGSHRASPSYLLRWGELARGGGEGGGG